MAGRNGPGPDRVDGWHRARSQRCHATGAGAFARLSGAGNCGSDARRGIAQDTACHAVALAGRGRGPHPGARPARKPTRSRRQSRGRDGGVAPWPAHLTQPGQRQPGGAPAQLVGQIKVGISSWTEPTLVKSGWYPPTATTAEDRLRYYASKFPIVEIDSTFYAIPNEKTAAVGGANAKRFHLQCQGLCAAHPASGPGDPLAEGSSRKALRFEEELVLQGPGSQGKGTRVGSVPRGPAAVAGCGQARSDRLPVPQVVLAGTGLLPVHGGSARMAARL